ncbi:MAG: hypothetical protein ACPH5S_06595, partial [Candidatus Poseidoniaceae archaeon]
ETPMVTIAIALIVFLLGVAGIARVAASRIDQEEADVQADEEDGEKVYPEAADETSTEEEQGPEDAESTEEPTDVAPWDDA